MHEAWIVEAARTPVGRYGGGLSSVRPDDLGALVLSQVVERSGVDASRVEDVVLGCSNQAGEDNRDIARMSALLAGFPVDVGGVTVNRLCGSGLEAVAQASRALMLSHGDVYLAGGVESMSRAPLAMPKPAKPFERGHRELYDTSLGWRFVNPRMDELGHTDSLGMTAENLVEQYSIPRSEQDAFALTSHRKAARAIEENRFAQEIVPVATRSGIVKGDESPRPNTSLEKLAALPAVFKDGGTVTAGNSSPLNDGAAALVLASAEHAAATGLRRVARVRAMATAGVPPRVMGIGPVPATRKALDRAGLGLDDIDVIEINEAFAGQVLAVLREWGVDPDDDRLNPNGGAIALGHPVGCTGARMMTTLLHHMVSTGAELGLATMCIGVGQGISVIVERPG